MIYRTLAFICLLAFYVILFLKMKLLKKRDFLKYKIHLSDSGKVTLWEIIIRTTVVIAPLLQLISIITGRSYLPIMCKVLGVYLGVIADVVLLLSYLHLKNNKAKNTGIYSYSRNPSYLGFDLIFISMTLMYCNPVLIAISVFAIVFFHITILKEEKYFKENDEDFAEYKHKTSRYYGFGKIGFKQIVCAFYLLLVIWCIFYFCTLIFYAGIFLSWIWIWILIGICAFIRFIMLKRDIDGVSKKKIPIIIRCIYYSLYLISLIAFIYVECNVFRAMTADPEPNLEYVIVLGAGLNGSTPSNTLRKRIEEGYTYMSDNPDTVLIASGGQGFKESISEAECIKRELVKMGIDEDRIILEDRSTSTIENLKYSLEIIKDKNARVGIITNSFHEYRAGIIAKDVGFTNAYSVPATTLMPVGIHYMLREFFGVVRLFMELIKY